MHWNNPLLVQGSKDSSGVKLYITPNIRANDLGSMVVGPLNLRLDPGNHKKKYNLIESTFVRI